MLNKSTIALRKNLVIAPDDSQKNRIPVSTVQAKLMQYGYMLDEQAFDALSKSDLSFIVNFNNEVITYLKNAMGGKYNFTPLYRNFPQEVMSLTDSELFWNAITHYWSNGTWEPNSPEMERAVAFEPIKYTMLSAGDEKAFQQIFTDLVSINTSLTPDDMKVIEWFMFNTIPVYPETIPFKENLMTLAAFGANVPVKTVTDVLRIAVHLSGGDISLPKVPKATKKGKYGIKTENPDRELFKFKKFCRSQRKYLLNLLENSNCDVREMSLKAERWVRLGEILHPGEYKKQFPKSYELFRKIRNEKVVSWYGEVEASFELGFTYGLKKLAERPGEFVRRLDSLLRNRAPMEIDLVLETFSKVAMKTSNKVLFEIYTHFENRLKDKTRMIMTKGARKKTELKKLPPMSSELVEKIHRVIFSTLKEKFSTLSPLGNCWIDEELKKIPLPTNMRSMSSALKPTIRGTRIPFGNKDSKVIRSFVHWVDKTGREDLDISATFVGKKDSAVLSFSTNGLRVGKSCHSGDVRHRKGNCAEYIDIDIANALALGYQYVLVDVRNFNQGSLKSVETVFGMMEREFPQSNMTWLPETVTNAQALESSSSNTLIAILDLESLEYVMLDIDSSGTVTARGDIENTLKMVVEYTSPPAVSVYDIMLMHVEARGRQVTLDSHVDTYFKFDDFSHSYEQAAKWML